jgi:hypothetical protein
MKTTLRGMSARGAGANAFVLAKMARSTRETNVESCMVMAWSFFDGLFKLSCRVRFQHPPLSMREARRPLTNRQCNNAMYAKMGA